MAGGAAAIQWGVCAGVGVGVQGEAAVVPAARGVYAVTCPAGSGVVWERLVLVGRSTSAAVAPAVVTAEKVVADAEVQQLPLQQSQQREQGQQRVAPWMTCVHSSGQPQHVVGGRGVCVCAVGHTCLQRLLRWLVSGFHLLACFTTRTPHPNPAGKQVCAHIGSPWAVITCSS